MNNSFSPFLNGIVKKLINFTKKGLKCIKTESFYHNETVKKLGQQEDEQTPSS